MNFRRRTTRHLAIPIILAAAALATARPALAGFGATGTKPNPAKPVSAMPAPSAAALLGIGLLMSGGYSARGRFRRR